MTTAEHLQEAIALCEAASSRVKAIVERAATIEAESPRSEADEADLRAMVSLALANLSVTNVILNECIVNHRDALTSAMERQYG